MSSNSEPVPGYKPFSFLEEGLSADKYSLYVKLLATALRTSMSRIEAEIGVHAQCLSSARVGAMPNITLRLENFLDKRLIEHPFLFSLGMKIPKPADDDPIRRICFLDELSSGEEVVYRNELFRQRCNITRSEFCRMLGRSGNSQSFFFNPLNASLKPNRKLRPLQEKLRLKLINGELYSIDVLPHYRTFINDILGQGHDVSRIDIINSFKHPQPTNTQENSLRDLLLKALELADGYEKRGEPAAGNETTKSDNAVVVELGKRVSILEMHIQILKDTVKELQGR